MNIENNTEKKCIDITINYQVKNSDNQELKNKKDFTRFFDKKKPLKRKSLVFIDSINPLKKIHTVPKPLLIIEQSQERNNFIIDSETPLEIHTTPKPLPIIGEIVKRRDITFIETKKTLDTQEQTFLPTIQESCIPEIKLTESSSKQTTDCKSFNCFNERYMRLIYRSSFFLITKKEICEIKRYKHFKKLEPKESVIIKSLVSFMSYYIKKNPTEVFKKISLHTIIEGSKKYSLKVIKLFKKKFLKHKFDNKEHYIVFQNENFLLLYMYDEESFFLLKNIKQLDSFLVLVKIFFTYFLKTINDLDFFQDLIKPHKQFIGISEETTETEKKLKKVFIENI